MTNSGNPLAGGNMKMLMALAAVLAVAGLVFMVFGPANKPSENPATKLAALPENIMGNADAPVTIIEYSSMTCPHCAVFHKETLPGLKAKYIDTGKVRYVLREYPIGATATSAFMLGRCLPKQEAYFQFIDMLYARQNEWATAEDRVGALRDLSKQTGFTDESFQACLDNNTLKAQILAVKNKGAEELRVLSTPTFFVNGTRVEGAQPLSEFEKLIDPLIK